MLRDLDRAAIDDLRERLRRSIVEGDAEAYTSCFAEDGVIMHPDSPQVRGREAIAAYAAGMFEVVSVPLLELSPIVVDGGGDLAFEVATQVCELEPEMPGFKRDRQHLHVYTRGSDGNWYVAAAMSGNQ
jgi:uncharacterized protein (TIGR02246 family)